VIKGLSDWPRDERPPVAIVFWSFRVMVGLGLLMIALGAWAVVSYVRRSLFTSRALHRMSVAMAPAGVIAILAGWYVTEVGRQPYTVYGIMKTSESVSNITGEAVAFSMLLYVVSYTIVFGAGLYYIFKLIKKGPAAGRSSETFGTIAPDLSLVAQAFPGLGKNKKGK
jgi:cytochrome d ubiquinol oxidase subunit I